MPRPKPRKTSGTVSTSAGRVRAAEYATQLEKRLHAAVCQYGNNYELAHMAGVAPDMLSRFVRKERSLRLDSAGKLAKVLGLTLTETT
jgi:hypothetical protein